MTDRMVESFQRKVADAWGKQRKELTDAMIAEGLSRAEICTIFAMEGIHGTALAIIGSYGELKADDFKGLLEDLIARKTKALQVRRGHLTSGYSDRN